jgi:predicted phosphodiesterase
MTKITFISDTHSKHAYCTPNLPGGDILIHSGDMSSMGYEHELHAFLKWFSKQKYEHKVFIAGNHDFAFENYRYPHHKGDYDWYYHLMNEENLSQSDVVYLEDNQCIIDSPEFSRPIKFWGSPWQPEFYNWAFNLPRLGDELKKYWDMIPDDTDVLITHGPPNEARDFVSNWRQGDVNVGCELLRHRVDQIKPLVHVFGHIHGAYGAAYIKDTLFVNASICTEQYIPSNKPIVVDLNEYDGEIVATYVEI